MKFYIFNQFYKQLNSNIYMNRKLKIISLLIILILLIALLSLYSFKSLKKFDLWKEHKDYFKNSNEDKKIQDWMTINFIENHFNLNIENNLNITLGFFDHKKELSLICQEHSLNCKKIIHNLNKEIK